MGNIIQIQINSIIAAISGYVLNIAGQGWIGSLSTQLLASFAIIFVILRGVQYYFSGKEPGELIVECMIRIGFASLLLKSYSSFFYGFLWRGMINDVAHNLGTLRLFDDLYEILLKIIGNASAINTMDLAINGFSVMVIGILCVICVVAYGVILLGMTEVLLVAGLFLAVGQLVVPLVLFDSTSPWFWAWLRNYIGALLGIGVIYFFMGALGEIPHWVEAKNALATIDDFAKAMIQVLNVTILFIVGGFVTIRSARLGREILS